MSEDRAPIALETYELALLRRTRQAREFDEETIERIFLEHRDYTLGLVASGELAAGEIAAAFDVTRTAVSQHLTVLRNAGLLTERREGTRRLYRARPEGLTGLRRFLDDMWASSLDAARRLVEAEEGITDDEEHASRAGIPADPGDGRAPRLGGAHRRAAR